MFSLYLNSFSISFLTSIKDSLLHLAFPHVCAGCGSDHISSESVLCISCLSSLPETAFHLHHNNPVEKLFWGRIPVTCATAQYYFTKESLMQHLMHEFKYKSNKELGLFFGRLMGEQLKQANRFSNIDALVPLPLFSSRERKRGYNQATILCEGIAEVWHKPVLTNVLVRKQSTETQTKKSRIERWQNMEGKFERIHNNALEGKHILLVDDVVTTGATLEACGQELLKAKDVKLSIATLCISST